MKACILKPTMTPPDPKRHWHPRQVRSGTRGVPVPVAVRRGAGLRPPRFTLRVQV